MTDSNDLHHATAGLTVLLSHRGDFRHQTAGDFLAQAERHLNTGHEHAGVKRRAFKVIVEALQNVVKHGRGRNLGACRYPWNSATVLIGQDDERYYVMTANPVPKARGAHLSTKLNALNAADKAGLKEMYKATLLSAHRSGHHGAGLGLLDMARQSGEKLEFALNSIDSESDLFFLKVNIPRGRNNPIASIC